MISDTHDTMQRMRPHEGVDIPSEPRWLWRMLGYARRGHRRGTKARTLRSWRVGR